MCSVNIYRVPVLALAPALVLLELEVPLAALLLMLLPDVDSKGGSFSFANSACCKIYMIN